MAKIALLPDAVRERIAAGEVVQRPSSALKELIENALDAGAGRIEVEIERGGKRRIRVTDDGEGMDEENLVLSVERYATSKLSSLGDLDGLRTLGFRGEALPSLAAVSELEILTRRKGSPHGLRLIVEHGRRRRGPEPAASPPGTTVEVRDLFARLPVRLKFMRSDSTEASSCLEAAEKLALSRPDVAFRVKTGSREALASGAGDLRSRSRDVFGRMFSGTSADALIELKAGESGHLALEGLVSPPGLAPRRKGCFFVNRRPVRDRVLEHAARSAYETLLPTGTSPFYVLFLDIDPRFLDVNVHPAKLEVRFRTPGSVHDFVARSLREALGRAGSSPPPTLSPEGRGKGKPATRSAGKPPQGFDLWTGGVPAPSNGSGRVEESAPEFACDYQASRAAIEMIRHVPVSARGAGQTRLLGRLRSGFLLVETTTSGFSGLRIIDPHALHERVLFEKMARALEGGEAPRQVLLVPETVELSASEERLLAEAGGALESAGLVVESFGPRTAVVRAVPQGLRPPEAAEVLKDVLRDLEAQVHEGGAGRSGLPLEAVKSLACRAAVKLSERLGPSEIIALLEQAEKVPGACPHGRPVEIRLSHDEIARRLGR